MGQEPLPVGRHQQRQENRHLHTVDAAPQDDRQRGDRVPEVIDRIAGMGEAGEHVGVPQRNLTPPQGDLGQDWQGSALVMLAVLLELVGVEVQQGGPAEEKNN